MNKKAKRAALFMSLSDKAKHHQFIVVEAVNLPAAKTKEFLKVMDGFKKAVKDMGKRQLWLMPKKDEKLVRASRNVPNVNAALASNLNIVDVLKSDTIVAIKDVLPVIEKTFLNKKV